MQPYFSNSHGYGDERRYATHDQHLFLDFRDYFDATTVTASTAVDFVVHLSQASGPLYIEPYRYVEMSELKAFCFPKIKNEMYAVLDIPEFSSARVHSSESTGANNKFAVIYFDSETLAAGETKPSRGSDFDKKVHVFNPPESNFNRFSVRILKYGNTPVTFGDLTQDGVVTESVAETLLRKMSMMLVFRIKK